MNVRGVLVHTALQGGVLSFCLELLWKSLWAHGYELHSFFIKQAWKCVCAHTGSFYKL